MSFLTDEDRRAKMYEKADIVMLWFEWIEQQYANLISRDECVKALAGFDAAPDTRPCEHRAAWRRGKLCLGCDNTGWRKATSKEREEGIARDPYSVELPDSPVKLTTAESSRAAMEAARIDNMIEAIDRAIQVQNGTEAIEDRYMRAYRNVTHKPRQARQVIATLRRIRHYGFDLFIDRYELALLVGSLIGRKLEPPRAVEVSATL